ncbi:REF/SRPP-like protein At1g67360 [Andrographis paniculata]|uniref:REF/SRPP-like protein At1g67360 n=1 Tax=Andrographis paniculata TaxID=175694 RepID=UPI0021E95767|nr:REF/SRPP-like protein At1g67360 [Andrographis paniculata]
MSSSEVAIEERSDQQLKYLGFVQILAVNAVVLVSNLYDKAKQNSGSLKPAVDAVENAVATVFVPVYERVKGIPSDLLVFVDGKVNDAAIKFDEMAPPSAKKALSKVQLLMMKASQTGQDLLEEAKVSGPLAAISHAGKMSQHFVVNQLAVVLYQVNQNPSLNGVSKVAITTAAQWSEKYNKLVNNLSGKGYTLFSYAPLIPVDELAKAYKQAESAANKKVDVASSSGLDNE